MVVTMTALAGYSASMRSRHLLLVRAAVAVLVPPVTVASAATPPPPGANVPCQPTAAHPEPVMLVHGTAENMSNNWQAMSPALKAAGYCVYAFDYGSYNGSGAIGVYGLGPIERSAQELATEVDTVLAQTGASKVDLVGHSQGGMMPRYYLKNIDSSKVDDLVGLSPSNHGTTNQFASPLGGTCAPRAPSRPRARRSSRS